MSDSYVDDTGAIIPLADTATPQVNVSSSWDYEQSSGTPASGIAYQTTNGRTLTINLTDHNAVDRTAFFNQIAVTDTVTCNGVTWNIISKQIVGSTAVLGISPPVSAPPFGVTTLSFTTFTAGTGSIFPAFNPIVPPPLFGVGGGPPPTFPPPTPPPIGQIPPGILVGPAIAAAAVPPSNAGFPLIRYATGSATVPAANGYFTKFTTAPYAGFPNQPPTGVPIVFSNISTIPTFSGGVWTTHPPPSTPTTAVIAYQLSLMETEAVPQSLSAAAVPHHKRRRRVINHQPSA